MTDDDPADPLWLTVEQFKLGPGAETPSLNGCWHKFHRAEEHALLLNREINEYLKSKPYRFVRGFDTEAGAFVLVAKTLRAPSITRWGVVLGDMVHDLRGALDHLAWQLARLSGVWPKKSVQFPIELTHDGYWLKKGKGPSVRDARLRDTNEEYRTLIDKSQPYNAQNPEQQVLNMLNILSNVDKHRFVHSMQIGIEIQTMLERLTPNDDAGEPVGGDIHLCPFDGDAQVARIIYSCPGENPALAVSGELPINIWITSVGMRVSSMLTLVVPEVKEILERSVPFFQAAGAID